MVKFSPLPSTLARAPRRATTLAVGDDLRLAVEQFGDASAPPVVFAHGFGQTRHAWEESAIALAGAGWYCVTVDARGHGGSGWVDDGRYDYKQFIDDLAAVARASAKDSHVAPILVGASMGGLVGLCAQALHPTLFRALVLVDITPRWEAAGVARILGFMRAHPQGFATFDEAADAIASYLPHRAERKSPEQLRKLLIVGDDGRLRWHWDPRLLDLVEGESSRWQGTLVDAARSIAVPTLLVSGARSDVVSDKTINEFLDLVPHARHARIAEATHMVAGDANTAFARAVEDFMDTLPSSPVSVSA
jgi:pimeloyl-ACP methyl ester carboxylesterase